MLTPDYLLHVSEGAEEIAAKLHTQIIQRIARRIVKREKRGDDYVLTAVDKWQIQALTEMGELQDEIIEDIARATKLQKVEIAQAFEDAGVKSVEYEDGVYEQAGISPVKIQQTPYMIRLMQRNYNATMGEWANYCRTTADAAQGWFYETLDRAYNGVTSGAFGYVQAFTDAIDDMARHGVTVTYPSGHTDTIETATLRAVRTGVSQASAQITLERMRENDVDLVIVSSHMGARPSHQVWQGKVYSMTGKKYPDFVSSTGYGTGPGLCGWNCRHSFSPYFEGQGNPFERYADEENVELYEQTQQQRKMERGIRKTKREVAVLEDAARNTQDEALKVSLTERAGEIRKRLRGQNKAYTAFCDEHDLRPLKERLQIAKRK